MFNARGQEAASSPVFGRLLGKGRCVCVLGAFYEFAAEAAGKQPYKVFAADGSPLFVAGLRSTWYSAAGPVDTFGASEAHQRFFFASSELG